ncbi:MAG TPA: hypothetical protein VK890_12445 [Bacteroidia bacterium]|jgi:hypothetical protein|nr:hypothetical protein [Bacteroidia bacterium]
MGEKLTNKDFDDIFREGINDMDTQPSESFWIKASEDSLFNSTQAKKKAVGKWKLIAASLAAAVVVLSAYIIYQQKEINGIGQRPVITEKKNIAQPIVSIISSNASQIQHPKPGQKTVTENTTVKPLPAIRYKKGTVTQIVQSSNYTQNKISSPPSVPRVSGLASNSNNGNNFSSNNSGLNVVDNQNPQEDISAFSSNSIQLLNATYSSSITTNSSDLLIPADNIVPVQNNIKPEGKSFLSKLSVSLFYEPYLSDELLENQSADIVTYNNVSGNEEEVKPFIAGIKMGYDISKHWTVTTGCFYYNFTVGVSPTTIYAQKQQNGDVGYSFQTGMGAVTCPYINPNPNVGEAITVGGNEIANYISIPLQVKYNFITTGNWRFYLTAGVTANIVAYRKMVMHWEENTLSAGNATEGIENSKKIYGSYYFAPAISYSFLKQFSVFLEPSLQGSPVFSSAKNSTPYIGIGTGITYHL